MALALALLMCGCHSIPEKDKAQAVAAAKEEMRQRGWTELELQDARFDNGCWRILLWRLPKVPGGHATVEVSRDGKVKRVIPGL